MLSTGINDGESSLFTLRVLLDERKGGAVDLINLLEQLYRFYDSFLSHSRSLKEGRVFPRKDGEALMV
jgi:hypothetical protein